MAARASPGHQVRQRLAVDLRHRGIRLVGRDRRIVFARVAARRRAQHPRTLLDQRIAWPVLYLRNGVLQRATLGFGDSAGGDRMRAEQFRNLVWTELRAPAHGLEEAVHRVGVVARRGEDADADPVGLVLVLAGEIDLRLDREVLRGGDGAHRGVRVSSGHRADQDCRQRRRGRDEVRASLRLDAARDVSLRDVRDFVRQDGRELALALGLEQQAGVNADESARQRERVDRRIADQEEREVAVAVVRHAREAQAERLQVLADLRVLEHAARIAEPAHHHAADAVLVLEAEGGLGRRAHLRQLVLDRLLGEERRGQQHRAREQQACERSGQVRACGK